MKVTSLTAVTFIALAPAAYAQGSYKKDIPDSLATRAKISEPEAAAIADSRAFGVSALSCSHQHQPTD